MEVILYPVVSCVSILFAIIMYLVLWKKHNLHGWTQFAFLISAFFYFAILSVRKMYNSRNQNMQNFGTSSESEQTTSLPIERLYTFFTLAHFTNIVNLSATIFWTFLKVEPEYHIRKLGDLNRLFHSLLLCWAFSASIAIAELFITDGTIQLLERALLIALLVLNVVIVALIFMLIVRLIKEAKRLQSSSNHFDLKSMVSLFVRLVIITGLIWTVKIIPLLVPMQKTGLFWRTMKILTESYGVAILIVFVFNSRILSALKERFPFLNNYLSCCNFQPNSESRGLTRRNNTQHGQHPISEEHVLLQITTTT